jgi:3-isopropylmalate/(R)-2-methylmalate dehydratase large subunit
MAHDITGGIAINSFRAIGAGKVFDPAKIHLVADHNMPVKDVRSASETRKLRDFAEEFGIPLYDVGRNGIAHAFLPEQGIVLPGDLVVCADSHTCTFGALGAFATGMGSTDIAGAMAAGDVWLRVPPTIKMIFSGQPGKWVSGKDLILFAIGQIGVDGARYAALEFHGEAVEALSMDSRFTMSNMANETGGKAGLHRVNGKTLAYVKPRTKRPRGGRTSTPIHRAIERNDGYNPCC